ncbi:hypothetical protein ACSTKI_00380, partial [Vibrio parahaemolyticus]
LNRALGSQFEQSSRKIMSDKEIQLANYVNNLTDFVMVNREEGCIYQNMGATIIDGILQAGIDYKSTVAPRVNKYLYEYGHVTKTSEFKKLIQEVGVDKLITWKVSAKTKRIITLTDFFVSVGVETESDLYKWLEIESNCAQLLKINGIKCKTLDYFKILSGHTDTTAIDRHLYQFLDDANINYDGYDEAHLIIKKTAVVMEVNASILDHSIWKYMSERA